MDKLPKVTPGGSGSPNSQSNSNAARLAQVRLAGLMPPVMNKTTDLMIPRSAWSAWTEMGKSRCLRRALTVEERSALERRKNELLPWIVGYSASEEDDVIIALTKMFSAFPQYAGKSGHGAAAQVKLMIEALQSYPAWAIAKACGKIAREGYVRVDTDQYVRETHWPPSAPELIEVVRGCATLYKDQYDSATDLLEAEVEA